MRYISEYMEELSEKGQNNLFLEVKEDNIQAINLYLKLGFKKINERKNYYGSKTAIIMMKEL